MKKSIVASSGDHRRKWGLAASYVHHQTTVKIEDEDSANGKWYTTDAYTCVDSMKTTCVRDGYKFYPLVNFGDR